MASGHLGRALKLERRGRLVEARKALGRVLDSTNDDALESLKGAHLSTRLTALTRMASLAATMNDEPEAVKYATDGLALWSQARLAWPATRDVQFFTTWESWARNYLARGRH
jgi:hypothetical protein